MKKAILILIFSIKAEAMNTSAFCQAVAQQFEKIQKEEHDQCLLEVKKYKQLLKEYDKRFSKADQDFIDKVKVGFIYRNQSCENTIEVWDKNHLNACLRFISSLGIIN